LTEQILIFARQQEKDLGLERAHVSSAKAKINMVLQELSFSQRNFAPSREPPDLARSREGREEAMIADLKHYPVMKLFDVLLQLHHP